VIPGQGFAALLAALAAVALVPRGARAGADEGIPAGHFYFGITGQAVQPFGRALISREPLTVGPGGGFYLHYEGEHFLIGGEIGGGRFGNDDTYSNPFILAVRGGPIFGSGRFAPYFAAGIALLAYGAIGDDAATARGLSGEVGLLLFRDLRWFRLTAFLQYNLPLSGGSGKGVENVTSLSWGALGVRLQL
jgi:hypothetical protein